MILLFLVEVVVLVAAPKEKKKELQLNLLQLLQEYPLEVEELQRREEAIPEEVFPRERTTLSSCLFRERQVKATNFVFGGSIDRVLFSKCRFLLRYCNSDDRREF